MTARYLGMNRTTGESISDADAHLSEHRGYSSHARRLPRHAP